MENFENEVFTEIEIDLAGDEEDHFENISVKMAVNLCCKGEKHEAVRGRCSRVKSVLVFCVAFSVVTDGGVATGRGAADAKVGGHRHWKCHCEVWTLKTLLVVVVAVGFVVVVGMREESWFDGDGNAVASHHGGEFVFQNIVASSKRIDVVRLSAAGEEVVDILLIIPYCCWCCEIAFA